MATDAAPKIDAIRHSVAYIEKTEGFSPDFVVDLDVGAPLRQPEDIEGCLRLFGPADVDAAVTIYESERNPYFNMVEVEESRLRLVKQTAGRFVCRQQAPKVYSVSGSVFAFRRTRLMEVSHLYTGRWAGFVVPRERAIDIDAETDFQFVDFLMQKMTGQLDDPVL